MTLHDASLLFSAAVLGGALNSVAGGGGFLCFPALIFTGMPPINANATNTMALWPGTVASTGAYRRELTREHHRTFLPLILAGLVGGTIGAVVLLKTPQATFLRMVPYLLGSATLLFVLSGRITAWVKARTGHITKRTTLAVIGTVLLQLGIAVYIGFFGAGAGIMMLALFALMGVESIHTMNAYKTLMASVCNAMALIAFILARAIFWPQAILMLIGAAAGGYAGAYYAQKVHPDRVRALVILIGASMSIYFFARQGF